MQITTIDHLVLTVRDIEATIAFYRDVLGMQPRTFGTGRRALHFGAQKINLHQAGNVPDPNVRHATPGSADLCFLTDTPLAQVITELRTLGVRIIEGPVVRTGASSSIRSVYVYDPDENLIEIANVIVAAV